MEGSIRDKLKPVSPGEIEYLNLLVYGEPGVGKTTLVGTALDHAKTGPLLVLDIDGGMTTLRKRPNVDVMEPRTYEQVMEICRMLKEENKGYYKTVAIDSITELQKVDMAAIMRDVVNADRDRDPDVASLREWGKTGEHMRRIIRNYRDLPMNVILTAHSMQDKDEAGVPTYWPSIPGKMRTEIAGFIDIVGYMHVAFENNKLQRKIQFTKTRRVIAKDRTASLGAEVIDPTIPMLWDLIFA